MAKVVLILVVFTFLLPFLLIGSDRSSCSMHHYCQFVEIFTQPNDQSTVVFGTTLINDYVTGRKGEILGE